MRMLAISIGSEGKAVGSRPAFGLKGALDDLLVCLSCFGGVGVLVVLTLAFSIGYTFR